jgi:hypothetical protein
MRIYDYLIGVLSITINIIDSVWAVVDVALMGNTAAIRQLCRVINTYFASVIQIVVY